MSSTFNRQSLAMMVMALSAAGAASIARASLIIATDSQTNGTNTLPHTYTPSSTDLLNGLAATGVTGNFTQEGTGGTPVLTDGTFTSPITRNEGGPFQFGAFATGGNTGGTSLTYTLPAAKNLTSIVVYGGWQDGGRDQQSYSVLYSTAADPTTFLPLGTVNFNPTDPGGHPQVTRVTLTDTTGTLASNVQALQFNFNNTENGYSGYSGYAEIDAFGSSVPEPASFGLLGLASLGLFARRRRTI